MQEMMIEKREIEQRPMVVARRVQFSSAHFYKSEQFSDEQNREAFGLCYDPHGHGHNYVLEVFISGPIDPASKLVINISDLDALLKEVVRELDHKHLNFEIAEFKLKVPTTENIGHYLRKKILVRLANRPNLRLNRLRLFETDDLCVEIREPVLFSLESAPLPAPPQSAARRIELTREVVIRAIHFLENSQLTPEENRELYGICYGKHGHHYRIQVTVGGELNNQSGLLFDRDRLDRILEASVLRPFDGANLNELFPNTACEALARAIYLRLLPLFPDGTLRRIGIQETLKNYFEFPTDGLGEA